MESSSLKLLTGISKKKKSFDFANAFYQKSSKAHKEINFSHAFEIMTMIHILQRYLLFLHLHPLIYLFASFSYLLLFFLFFLFLFFFFSFYFRRELADSYDDFLQKAHTALCNAAPVAASGAVRIEERTQVQRTNAAPANVFLLSNQTVDSKIRRVILIMTGDHRNRKNKEEKEETA